MENDGNNEQVIERAARRGARSVTSRRQIIDDAVTATFEKWEDALLRQRVVPNWVAWAFKVAANAARRLGRNGAAREVAAADAALAEAALPPSTVEDDADAAEARSAHATARRLLRAHLAQKKNLLRGRQLEVLTMLAKEGVSFHQAAKQLGMKRFNVTRAFRSALRRVLRHSK